MSATDVKRETFFEENGGEVGGAGEVIKVDGIDGSSIGVFADAVGVRAVGDGVSVNKDADVGTSTPSSLIAGLIVDLSAGTDDVEECRGGEFLGFETRVSGCDALGGSGNRGVEPLIVVRIEISENFACAGGGIRPMLQGGFGVNPGVGDVVFGGDAINQLGEKSTELAN